MPCQCKAYLHNLKILNLSEVLYVEDFVGGTQGENSLCFLCEHQHNLNCIKGERLLISWLVTHSISGLCF